MKPQEPLPQHSADAEQAIHVLNEWRVKQAAKLRDPLHHLRAAMEAARELLRDGAAPPSGHSNAY